MEILSPRGAIRERGRGPGKPTTGGFNRAGASGKFHLRREAWAEVRTGGGAGVMEGRTQRSGCGHVGEARRRPAAQVSGEARRATRPAGPKARLSTFAFSSQQTENIQGRLVWVEGEG